MAATQATAAMTMRIAAITLVAAINTQKFEKIITTKTATTTITTITTTTTTTTTLTTTLIGTTSTTYHQLMI